MESGGGVGRAVQMFGDFFDEASDSFFIISPFPPHHHHSIPLDCFQNELPACQQYAVTVAVAPLGGSPGESCVWCVEFLFLIKTNGKNNLHPSPKPSAAAIDLRRADVTVTETGVDVMLPPGMVLPALGGGVRVVFDF